MQQWPPATKHPEYDTSTKAISRLHQEHKVTTIIAGDLNIPTWKRGEYKEWIEQNELWTLADPDTPTFKTGSTTDAILAAIGNYIQEGFLTDTTENDTEGEKMISTRYM